MSRPRVKTKSRNPAAAASAPAVGLRLAEAGVVMGAFAVAAAMVPGGYNPFGPPKALLLVVGAAFVWAGLALTPALLVDAFGHAKRQWGAWAGAALVAIAVLSVATSIDASQSVVGHYPEYQGLIWLLASASVGLGAFVIAGREGGWRLLGRAAVVVLLLVFAYAAVQFFRIDPVLYQRRFNLRRVRSTLGNSSNLGAFLCLMLPLALAAARTEATRGWKWMAWAAVVTGAITLAWSLSRGGWVGAIVGAIAWLVVEGRSWGRPRRLKVAGIAAGAAVVAAILVIALVPNALARVSDAFNPSSDTSGWRLTMWSLTARMIAERPLLGFGPATYRYAIGPRRTAATYAGETGVQSVDDPHNAVLSAGVQSGVLAALALLALAAASIVSAWRLGDDERAPFAGAALAAGIAGSFTALQFHFFTLDTAPLFAVLAATALGMDAVRSGGPTAAPTGRALTGARAAAGVAGGAFAIVALLAAGLVVGDQSLARGYADAGGRAPWPITAREFAVARGFAPWEPAYVWAQGRAATQTMSGRKDAAILGDSLAAFEEARRRLPVEPLVVAQEADAYLVAGVVTSEKEYFRKALGLADDAITMEPASGFRWEQRGSALAGSGDWRSAMTSYEKAVRLAPEDKQAWMNLALAYDRLGRPEAAEKARQNAQKTLSRSGAPTLDEQ